jgi:PAS domain S-box-containing protein
VNTPVFGPNLEVLYIIHRIEDVTELVQRDQAWAALHKSDQRFHLASQAAKMGVYDFDVETNKLVWSESLWQLLGLTPAEDPTRQLLIGMIHPDDLQSFLDANEAAFSGSNRGPYEVETRLIRADGQTRWLLNRAVAFYEDPVKGPPSRIVGTVLDITDRKRAEDALRESEAKFQRIAHEQQFLAEVGAILASSLEYEDTLASIAQLAVRELADFCLIEVIEESATVSRLVVHHDSSKTELLDALRQLPSLGNGPHLAASVLDTRQPLLTCEVTVDHLRSLAQNDDHLRALCALGPKSYIAVPLLAHGRLLGILVLVRTSEQLRYDARDLPLAEELARRAALAVQSAQLYQAAQRAVAAREDVLGIVAHDLRNPLNAILLKSQLLSHTARRPDLTQDAEDIRRAALRMTRLIQDLLDVGRLEVGRLSVELVPIPADQIVIDAVGAHRLNAVAADLELRCELPDQLPAVLADRDRVLQVLGNLIENATKFTPSGGQVTVGAAARTQEVLFWVADTGPGIASHDLRYLFDRFWQAHRADRRGVGLGLSIAKGIVEVHGGRLWVESTSERGSKFCFTLPTVPGGK